MFLLSVLTEHGVIRESGVLLVRGGVFRVQGGVWLVENAGLSLLHAHPLIVLLWSVVVTVQVPPQLVDVTNGC